MCYGMTEHVSLICDRVHKLYVTECISFPFDRVHKLSTTDHKKREVHGSLFLSSESVFLLRLAKMEGTGKETQCT